MPFGLLCCVRPGVEDVVELDYSHQSLTDVPNEVFAHERTLETLLCQSNRITELPRQLFMCHGLKLLDLSDNEIQSIPAAVSSLVHLQQLNLNRNTLGSLPDTMKALKYLKFLDLSVNPLEKLPDAITNLMALQELYLNDTYMEFLPGNFGRLSNLRILELRDNYLMILPKSLSRSTDLLRLDIGQNEFADFPEVIGRFNKLKELWIDCNSLTSIPEGIKSLENLQHLEASNNMIEELAMEIGYCTKLVDVSLTANCLTQLPDTIGLLSNLTTLKLDNNRLYSLPESIGSLKSLEELMLMCNYLDKLPSSMGLLRNLQYLNLDENMLVTIPPEIGSCIKLSVLSIRSNKLTKIPPEIGHLSNLKVLNLVRNSLNNLPQSLLNCENLVALWLSENQSKPLLHMQSEVDPQTYEQVLTCLLFPQVPLSTNEPKHDSDKTENSDVQSSSRHISFVDLKAPPKIPEKPGQLRRAPTPYPKELRALAKHARNIQKDDTQEVTPPVPSAVIKAAKITPTLQQRFASDNKKDVENENVDKTDSVNHDNRKSVYDNIPNDNNYDKPLDLDYEQDKSYKAIDHSLYPNSNEVNNYTKTQEYNQDQFVPRNIDPYITRQGMHNSIPPPHPITGRDMEPSNYIQDNSGYRYNVNDAQRNIQRLSMCSQESKPSRAESQSIYGQMPLITNISNYDLIPVKQDPSRLGSNYSSDGIYEGDTYIQAREKIYGQRNYDLYGYNKHGSRNLHSPRIPTVSQVVSNSTTMPNLSNYNTYAGSDVDSHYQIAHQACPTSYGVQPSSPTYVSTQTPELYSPTGHTNLTNPYRMTNTPLVSDDGSYGHIHPSAKMYDVYDTLSTTSRTPSVHNQQGTSTVAQPIYGRGQPPPYHVAAPFTKHAQYFNGTGG